jgi:predicted AAA+ superfamily ATPase
MKQIIRKDYIDTLIELKDKNLIKILTGVRRCGKSTVMQLFRDHLKIDGVNENQIVFMNFEEFENYKWVNDLEGLYHHIIKQLDLTKPCYVFLDEIQNVKGFERLIDGLYVKPNIDVYVTGSNAYLLSSELGTLLTGRYYTIHILPFSFKEYLLTQEDISRTDLLFAKYMQHGGLPGAIELPDKNIRNYVKGVIDNIIQKDVFVRYNWHNQEYFNKTTSFLFDSIGSIISPKKITNTLLSSGIKISHNTIGNYIDALTECFLFYKVKRFDLKGKQLLMTQEKYYTVDLGFKKFFLGEKYNRDLGHNLENIVYSELIRRGNEVYIGKAGDTEIDFVVKTPQGDREYYQVAWSTKEQSTFEREIRPFELVKDYNKRILLTTDVEPDTSYKGIQKINVIDWLLKD